MASSQSVTMEEPLAVLSDAVNQTLIDTARFFKTSGSLQSRAQLKNSIPTSYQRFQTALDTLTEQIFIAKAFLEQDYHVVTAKRRVAPDSHAENIAFQPTSPPISVPPAVSTTVNVSSPAKGTAAVPEAIAQTTSAQDQIGTNKPEAKDTQIKIELPQTPSGTGLSNDKTQTTADPVENTTKPEPIDVIKTEEKPAKENPNLPQSDAAGDEMNFDQMLATTGQAPNDFDLNFNFSNDEIGNQNFLAGADFGTTNANTGSDSAALDAGTNSISSLLPGLESYATNNDGGDSFNFNLPKLEDSSKDDLTAPGESSFDDLFLEKDNVDGDDNLLGGGDMMDLGELDDSWLN